MNRFNALVVDDSSTVAVPLQTALGRLGCLVRVVNSTDEARSELSEKQYDLVFVELCARGEGGGRGIARWIKSRCLPTRCLLLTGWRGELDHSVLRYDGIHGVIRKPLIFNDIRDTMIDVLG